MLKTIAKKLLPPDVWKRLTLIRAGKCVPKWGSLRSTEPLSRKFGLDRGTAIDRVYIENFIADNSHLIAGRVLEIGDREYSTRFGTDKITQSDVLHAQEGNDQATIVGDLSTGQGLPKNAFDCIILTQTLQVIYDCRPAVANAYKSLAPGGVILATLAGISQISRYDMDRWGDYWRFNTLSARKMFEEFFSEPDSIEVQSHGNVLAACALLQGLCAEELKPKELEYCDLDYPVIITVKAVKSKE